MSRDRQVETIGDAYMVVSGAPTVSTAHAQNIANMALDMVASLADFVAPAAGCNIHIRIGQSTANSLHRLLVKICNGSVLKSVGATVRPPSWSDWIFMYFLHCFVSFVSRLNRKIRVQRLLVTPCFLPIKTCGNINPNLSFCGTENDFLWAPPPPPHPTPLRSRGPSLLKS